MVFQYSYKDLTRKVGDFKRRLYTDGFYRDQVVCKVITISGASGLFNRSATYTSSITIISGIAEYGPQLVTNHNVVESIDGDVRLTTRLIAKATILNATQLWLGCTLSGLLVKSYSGAVKYRVASNKPDMFGQDHIFVLKTDGEQS